MKAEAVQENGNPTGHGRPEDWPQYICDQGWENYTQEDHDVWKTLFQRQTEIIKGRACQEYIDGIAALKMDENQIPNFAEASKLLKEKTGWEVVAVKGLIPNLPFFQLLADRKFPAGNFIRTRDQLDYIEEPDVFHDFFGHVPLLTNPMFADYMAAFGKAGLRAADHDAITNHASLYWYTVEFGLIKQANEMRIYGAGVLSSPGETVFSLENSSPNRLGFDFERVMRTNYRVDDFQQTYFVIDDFKQLFEKDENELLKIYQNLKNKDDMHASDAVLGTDFVYQHGTQEYAKSKAKSSESLDDHIKNENDGQETPSID